jgi:ATP/maltotriose-dependent transcriptional regulator MalT
MAGDSAELTAELTKRALAALVSQDTPTTDYNVYTASRCLLVVDQFEFGIQVLDTVVEQAREHGAVVSEAVALAFRAEFHYRLGTLHQAQADAEASLQTTRTGWRVGLPSTASILAKVLVERGELPAAESTVMEGGVTGPSTSVGSSYPLTMLLHSRAGLRLAQGESTAALEDLLEVGRRQEIMGEPNPALIDWRSLAARALAELDRRDEALAFAEDEVRLARRFGAPRALGIALTAAGATAGGDAGLDRLREAEAVLAASPARLAYAHALRKLGSALRDRGERDGAREALGHAVDIAHACGATALDAHALRELRSTGARPRRSATRGPAALTPRERRTAELAAQGLSNREIAEALFVTVRTTEFHLNRAFEKLGIRSRHELTDELMGESARRRRATSAEVPPPETRH